MKTSFPLLKQCLSLQLLKTICCASLCLLATQAAAKPVGINPMVTAPIIVSVDHRVTVSYSALQFDAKKNVYTTQARIKNRSGVALLSPLRLAFNPSDLKNVHLLSGDGRPYVEFALPKKLLAAGTSTESVKIVFAIDKNKAVPDKQKKSALTAKIDRSTLQLAQRVSAGAEFALLQPRAEPSALSANSGKQMVRFSLRSAGVSKTPAPVFLRRSGDTKSVAMNDLGRDGDLVAKDGIQGVNIQVDTAKLKPDSCLNYEAFIKIGRGEMVSSPLRFCVSSFPVRIAGSDTAHPVTLSGGTQSVADEILVRFVQGTSAASIRLLLSDINATVAGSLLPRNLYQLKLSVPLSAERLMALIQKLQARPEVESAYPNALGAPASTPNDPEFSSQHGLQRVRAHDAWDANATGTGSIIAVLDTGVDRTHPDFGTVGNCQLADNDCGSGNTDFDAANGHGTSVAGVIAAKSNNALGVAGVAPSSKIKSILVGTDVVFTIAEMTQSFLDAEAYGIAAVVNASFAGGPWIPFDLPAGTIDVGDLCASINSVVLNGVTPVAIVSNAAGNNNSNGNFYPGRCNDSTNVLHAQLTRKDLFITVANSISVLPADSFCTPAATLDARCNNSNYGAWVDMAAPGMSIRTTAIGGGYTSPTGTSFSAPMVSGAAAILISCGVPLDQIETRLRATSVVTGS
ncbi:MAG: S8 family serine peptidase, partial [Gallionellaceae bacterium]|nr:S8 family serine peptidase [Gallionellaceae bacterium]